MSKNLATKKFEAWLTAKKLPQKTISNLLNYAGKAELRFESAERIMSPDVWFYFPGNTRWVLIGSCPNGDAIALDTVKEPGAVYFINHETIQDAIPDEERSVKVAGSISNYLQSCLNDPEFPYDYYEAKARA